MTVAVTAIAENLYSKIPLPQRTKDILLTGEELFAMGDIGAVELVKGKLIRMTLTGHPHGFIEGNFGMILGAFVYRHKLGRVLVGEVGLYTHRHPDTVRGMDVAFISHERLAKAISESYLDVAPELIVEVKSPGDSWKKIQEKLEEYFAIGVNLVWVADPQHRQVRVYRSPTTVEIFKATDTLSGFDMLPGFRALVADFF
jgi:Uma2 family endonuclease